MSTNTLGQVLKGHLHRLNCSAESFALYVHLEIEDVNDFITGTLDLTPYMAEAFCRVFKYDNPSIFSDITEFWREQSLHYTLADLDQEEHWWLSRVPSLVEQIVKHNQFLENKKHAT